MKLGVRVIAKLSKVKGLIIGINANETLVKVRFDPTADKFFSNKTYWCSAKIFELEKK